MTDLLKQIMKEYDEAKDDAEFNEDHPVFKMAEHIDEMKAKLDAISEITPDDKVDAAKYIGSGIAWCGFWLMIGLANFGEEPTRACIYDQPVDAVRSAIDKDDEGGEEL